MRSVCLLFEDESDRTQSFKASSWASKDSCRLDCAAPWSQVLRGLSGLPAAVMVNRKDGTPKKSSVARRPAKLLLCDEPIESCGLGRRSPYLRRFRRDTPNLL